MNNLPITPSDTDLNLPLHDYQKMVRQMTESTPYIGLFMDVGTGKTLITLSALYDMNPTGHVLIVAPKNIARSTWQDEINKWNIPLRTCSLVSNDNGKDLTKKQRMERYEAIPTSPPTVYFINRELLIDLIKNAPVKNKKKIWYFPIVILDESQSFKSHKSERFKALKNVRPAISRLIELTGTPTPKSLMDLWAQVYLLDQGQRLGTSITAFRNKFFYETKFANGFAVDWAPKPGAEDEIYRLVSDIVVSVKNPNIKLPDVTINDITIYMDPPEQKRYKDFMKNQVLPLIDGGTIIAANAAVLQAKLTQMASGTIYTNEQHDYEIIHDKKLDMLDYIIANTGSPVLIAYWFSCDKERILNHIQNAALFDGTTDMLHAWNRGEIPVMLMHPASSGFGLNMQDGGHTLVWYTLPWSLEAYIQTNGRLARQGQKHPVIIHRLITDKTMDARIIHALELKDMSEQALLDAVSLSLNEI